MRYDCVRQIMTREMQFKAGYPVILKGGKMSIQNDPNPWGLGNSGCSELNRSKQSRTATRCRENKTWMLYLL